MTDHNRPWGGAPAAQLPNALPLNVNLNVTISLPPEVAALLGNLTRTTTAAITRMETHMTKELDDLQAQVKRNSEVEASAVVLINGIADRIAAAGTDPTALKALTDELKSKDDELAAAVAANTPQTNPPDQASTGAETG